MMYREAKSILKPDMVVKMKKTKETHTVIKVYENAYKKFFGTYEIYIQLDNGMTVNHREICL